MAFFVYDKPVKDIPMEADEYQILSSYPVSWVLKSGFSSKTVGLTLTNKRIIISEKNVWGKITQIVPYPLSDLMFGNNKTPVSVGSTFFEGEVLKLLINFDEMIFKIRGTYSPSKWAVEIQNAYSAYMASRIDPSLVNTANSYGVQAASVMPAPIITYEPEAYATPIKTEDIFEGRVALFNIDLEENESIILGSDDVIIEGISGTNPYGMSVMITDKNIYVEYSDSNISHRILRYRFSAIKSADDSSTIETGKGKNGYYISLYFKNTYLTFSFPLIPDNKAKKYIAYWVKCIKDILKKTTAAPVESAPAAAEPLQRKFCVFCGASMAIDHVFCSNCGNRQE